MIGGDNLYLVGLAACGQYFYMWNVDCGIWQMAHGLCKMAYVIWHMAYDIRNMDYEVCNMVYGTIPQRGIRYQIL